MVHMKTDDPKELKEAVETLHHCNANLIESADVTETFQGQTVWQGVVHVFKIEGHPAATRCYAWSSPIEGSTKRKFFAVLQLPPIASAKDAVKVAIVQEYRNKP
jgi:hypothetical protein